jgi:hypothetical protein
MSEQCANNSVQKWQTEGSEFYVFLIVLLIHTMQQYQQIMWNSTPIGIIHDFIKLELKSSDS